MMDEVETTDEMIEAEVMRLAKHFSHEARIRVVQELMAMHIEDEKREAIRVAVERAFG